MTVLPWHDQALFETTRRVLAEVVNEGLVGAKLETTALGGAGTLCLLSPQDGTWVKVGVKPGTVIEMKEDRVISVVRPASLQPPVIVGETGNQELDPGAIFGVLSASFKDVANETVLEAIIQELRNSARNQEKWLEISQGQQVLGLQDTSAKWERALIYGHPSHPYHRLCYAQEPLKPVSPEDIPAMLTPTLAFVSVPRDNLRITGHFEQELQPLLKRLNIPQTTSDRVIVPCLAQQLPSVHQRFPDAVVLKLTADCADAQASMRTLTMRPELGFGYHLKLSLACQITSALRTITPWTTCGGPVQTALLEKFLPEDLWVFREMAAVSGSQEDFNEARHLSCILRDSLESRSQANDEVLILAAAFGQQPYGESRTYAEILYNLETVSLKKEWLQRYVTVLFSLVLPPLVQYGIGLEGHGQNLVARVCRQTGQIKGFAVRDFGGVRMHVPTLKSHGVKFDSLPPGGATLTDNLQNVWSKVHHSLLQNHVGLLLEALGLENHGGWAITLEALSTVLGHGQGSLGAELLQYFTKDTMPFKCFLRMRMESKYRDYIEREVPNVLLMDSSRWKSILHTYQPSLHAT
ncbi:IucC family-domain-containing protein [Aspergillus pseudocaelatus]|uniref:IucC family-domain-containing protein n=1 Tax=Aspergillus pseudocaelatus TaxID=1825620 RepID=A0ABQ6WZL7_9EURO|nr:IucC family-domain-containing protein [Aspergillus pseudocaelatus]